MKLVFHIGLHKTGTTTLQRAVFNSHPEVLYLGKPWINKSIESFFVDFVYCNPLLFEPEFFWRKFDSLVRDMMKGYVSGNWKAILVSQESLHSGPQWFGDDVVVMSDKLKRTFPESYIILSFRNQASYIESLYKNYVNHGGKMSLRRFLYDSYEFNYGMRAKLEFDKLLSLYINLFGRDRVYVYLFEDLKRSLDHVVSGIQSFLGLSEGFPYPERHLNIGLSPLATKVIRVVNHLMADDFTQQYYQIASMQGGGKKEYVRRNLAKVIRRIGGTRYFRRAGSKILNVRDISYIQNRFADSNRRLSELLDRDLSELGYYVD